MSPVRFARPLPCFFMGKSEANERIGLFQASKHTLLSNAMGNTDTKSIWYSFKHMEDIYKELVFLNADGLRVYLATYEDNHPEYPGQLCLVMVPTRLNPATLGHEDVIMEEDADFPDRPGSERFLGEKDFKPFNYGSPCPSICPSDDDSKYPFQTEE